MAPSQSVARTATDAAGLQPATDGCADSVAGSGLKAAACRRCDPGAVRLPAILMCCCPLLLVRLHGYAICMMERGAVVSMSAPVASGPLPARVQDYRERPQHRGMQCQHELGGAVCSSAHPIPVLKHQSVDGCLLVRLGRHFVAQVLHKRLHDPVVLVTHLQSSLLSTPGSKGEVVHVHAAPPCGDRRALA